jgi:hypothetical protein
VTYKQLLDFLKSLEQNADNRLEDGVTVWDMEKGEYHPAELLTMDESDGIMEAETMFLGFGLEGGLWQGG